MEIFTRTGGDLLPNMGGGGTGGYDPDDGLKLNMAPDTTLWADTSEEGRAGYGGDITYYPSIAKTGGDLLPNMGGGSGGGGGTYSPDGSYEPSDGFKPHTDLRPIGPGDNVWPISIGDTEGTGGLYLEPDQG